MNDRLAQIQAIIEPYVAIVEERRGLHPDSVFTAAVDLLAMVRERDAALERVAAIHTPEEVFEIDPTNGTWVYDDKTDERVKLATLCRECTHEGVIEDIESGSYDGGGTDGDVHWPCPTIAAITATEGA